MPYASSSHIAHCAFVRVTVVVSSAAQHRGVALEAATGTAGNPQRTRQIGPMPQTAPEEVGAVDKVTAPGCVSAGLAVWLCDRCCVSGVHLSIRGTSRALGARLPGVRDGSFAGSAFSGKQGPPHPL